MKWNLELHVDQITFDPPQKGWRNSLKQCQEGQKLRVVVVGLAQFSTHKSRTFSYFAGKKDHKSLLPYARLVLPLEVTEKKRKNISF